MKRYLWASALAMLMTATAPMLAHAQQTDEDRTMQRGDRDDNGEWGWLGLLGLIGLVGLRRRDREDVTHRPAAAR